MTQRHVPTQDPVEALFGAVLAGSEGAGAMSSSGAAAKGSGPTPVNTAWTLEIPRGTYVEMNIVKAYKGRGLVPDKRIEDEGWMACTFINNFKRAIVQNPGGCDTRVIVTYASALMLVREHLATNAVPYSYGASGQLSSPSIDFELYMTLALLSARDTLDALEARRYQTDQGYVRAFQHYMHAADILDETRAQLCTVPPPRDRLNYGNEDSRVPWLTLVAPSRDMPVATVVKYIDLRAQLLRCEAYVAAYRALELAINTDNPEESATLDGAALFVSSRFQNVAHGLRRLASPQSTTRMRMELYASFMASLFKLLGVHRQATADLDIAERELNVTMFARALRRIDRTACPVISPDEWTVAGPGIVEPMRAVLKIMDALRSRSETLRSNDSTGAFLAPDLSSAATEPLPVEEVDPSFVVEAGGTEAMERFSLVTLKTRAVQSMKDLVLFLSLRTDTRRVLDAVHASPALPAVPHSNEQGRNVADGIFAIFCHTLRHSDTAQRRLLIQERLGNAPALADLLLAVYNLGNLAERRRWTQYAFAGEEPQAPGEPISPMAQEMNDIDAHLKNAAGYFAMLSKTLDLPA